MTKIFLWSFLLYNVIVQTCNNYLNLDVLRREERSVIITGHLILNLFIMVTYRSDCLLSFYINHYMFYLILYLGYSLNELFNTNCHKYPY